MSVTVTPDSPLSPQALAELHELEKLSDEQQMDLLTREGKEVKKKRWADLLKTLGGDELKAPELPDDAFEQTRLRLERRRMGERSPERSSPTFFADEELDDDVVDWNALGNDDDDDEGLFGELPIQNVEDVRQAVQLSPGQCGMYTKRGNCKDDNDCVWNPKKDPKCQKRQRKKRQRKTSSPKAQKSSPPRGSPHRSSLRHSSSSDIIDLTKSSPKTPKSSPPRGSPPRDSLRREFKARSWGPGSSVYTSPKKRRSSSSVEKKRRSKKRKIKYNIRYLNKEIKRLQKKRAALLLLYESM